MDLKVLICVFLFLTFVKAQHCTGGQRCTFCDLKGYCKSECEQGYYDPKCGSRCSAGCLNNSCIMTGKGIEKCTRGCVPGYYGTRCNMECEPSPDECSECPVSCINGFCNLSFLCVSGCNASYYGNNCKSCSDGCKECNRTNGVCTECFPMFGGEDCAIRCTNCNGSCQNGCTSGCSQGFHGTYCDQLCPENCKSNCDQRTGSCISGCRDGWSGVNCTTQCSNTCRDSICDSHGLCTNGCLPGHHGPDCISCPTTCLDNNCFEKNGSCRGCVKGQHGEICNISCGNCRGGVCYQETGVCMNGCVENYTGETCLTNCSVNCLLDACSSASVCKSDKRKEGRGDLDPVASIHQKYIITTVCVIAGLFVLMALFVFISMKRISNNIYKDVKLRRRRRQRIDTDQVFNNEETISYTSPRHTYHEISEQETEFQIPVIAECFEEIETAHDDLFLSPPNYYRPIQNYSPPVIENNYLSPVESEEGK